MEHGSGSHWRYYGHTVGYILLSLWVKFCFNCQFKVFASLSLSVCVLCVRGRRTCEFASSVFIRSHKGETGKPSATSSSPCAKNSCVRERASVSVKKNSLKTTSACHLLAFVDQTNLKTSVLWSRRCPRVV